LQVRVTPCYMLIYFSFLGDQRLMEIAYWLR
jgi:hypothetical protein